MNSLVIFVVLAILSLSHESTSLRVRSRNVSAIDQILMESFKRKFLKTLGFSTVPNVSVANLPKIPHILRSMVEAENNKYKLKEDADDRFYAKTKRLFLFPDKDNVEKNYLFKANSAYMGLEIKSATLWVSITKAASSYVEREDGTYELVLYRCYKATGKDALTKELFHSEQVNRTGWHSIEVSFLVKDWFSLHPAFNLSLEIAIKRETKATGGVAGIIGASEAKEPFLVVDTGANKYANKRKRSSEEHLRECGDKEPRNCCRGHLLKIDFKALGWNFIIAPNEMETYECAGVCGSKFGTPTNLPMRTQVLINVNLYQPVVCCRPIEFIPTRIIYISSDGNETLVRDFPDLLVAKCSCIA